MIKTTIPDTSAPCPRDKVTRVFRAPAPNLLRDAPWSRRRLRCSDRWRNMQHLEIATLGWLERFNNRRLPGRIGNIPPAEAEENSHAQRDVLDTVA